MIKRSIRLKITVLVLIVSLFSLIVLGTASIVDIIHLKENIIHENEKLGKNAAQDSIKILESQTIENLSLHAKTVSEAIDVSMEKIKNLTKILVLNVNTVFSNPDRYSPMPINPPEQYYTNPIALYYIHPHDVKEESVLEQAGLAANCGRLVYDIVNVNEEIAGSYISFETGLHVAVDEIYASRYKNPKNYNPTTRSWYKKAKKAGKSVFSDVFNDSQGRGLAISCSAPIYDKKNEFIGAVGVGATLSGLEELISSFSIGKSGKIFLLNEKGQLIISHLIKKDAKGNVIRPDLLSYPHIGNIVKKMMDKKSGVERTFLNGKEIYIAYSPLKNIGWSVASIINRDEALSLAYKTQEKIQKSTNDSRIKINASIFDVLLLLAGTILGTIALVLFLSFKFAKKLTQPIIHLRQGMKEIAGGHLETRISIQTGDEIEELGYSANAMTVALQKHIEKLQSITAEKERISAELNIATQIQSSMLPCIFPAFPDREEFDIFALMEPAKEVGGDFYDFFLINDKQLAVVIADVSGKGVPAALFMVITKTLIKNYALINSSPAEIFYRVNNQLCENNDANLFVTAWMGILDIESGRFVFVNAGHNPPLLKRENGSFDFLESAPAFVLAGMENIPYQQNEIWLNQGDILYLYTDGVTEATDAENNLYGEERLRSTLDNIELLLPDSILTSVKEDIDVFVKEAAQFDDITMCCLKICKDNNTITLPAVLDGFQDAVHFIENILERMGFSKECQLQIAVAVEEIFVNIVHYAYDSKEGEVIISVNPDETGSSVRIQFADTGVPYNPLVKKDPDTTMDIEERTPGGLGIYMVKNIMDNVYYERKDGKNIFTIVKNKE